MRSFDDCEECLPSEKKIIPKVKNNPMPSNCIMLMGIPGTFQYAVSCTKPTFVVEITTQSNRIGRKTAAIDLISFGENFPADLKLLCDSLIQMAACRKTSASQMRMGLLLTKRPSKSEKSLLGVKMRNQSAMKALIATAVTTLLELSVLWRAVNNEIIL